MIPQSFSYAAVAFALSSVSSAGSLLGSYNGLAVTPAMGWDNWNSFGCDVSEDLLLGTAQKIVNLGLKDLGYNYVVLDDCWSDGRYENGSLRPDFTKFPNGMKNVGDRIHELGLKFGMYSSAGYYTCGRYAASLGKEKTDANTFASWGVDYLKYDNCYNGGQAGTQALSYNRYNAMSEALNATGRPILYSMCNWGDDSPWNWAQTMANSWRMSGDIYDSFNKPNVHCPCTGDEMNQACLLPGYHCSVMNILNKAAAISSKTESGAQNDLDMLEVGNGGMTDDEYKVHFSMWAMMSSPMLIGADIRKFSPQTLSIYSNPAVLAINQDPAVASANRLWRFFVNDTDENGEGEISAWSRTLNSTDMVVALINGGNNTRIMNLTLADIFQEQGGARSTQATMNYDVYDLWGYRMDNATASAVLNGTAPVINNTNSTMRWNATATSYADGIRANATALMGKKIMSVPAMGTLRAIIPRHGIGFYRMKATGSGLSKRDEL